MVTSTIDLRPLNLTADFVREFRVLAKEVGYRTLVKAICLSTPRSNGHQQPRAATRSVRQHHWACGTKKRKGAGINTCACGRGQINTRARNLGEWLRLPATFYPSFRQPIAASDYHVALRLEKVAAVLRGPECCGTVMGVSPDFTNPIHWRYQCAVNPNHHQDTELVIWGKAHA